MDEVYVKDRGLIACVEIQIQKEKKYADTSKHGGGYGYKRYGSYYGYGYYGKRKDDDSGRVIKD